MPFSKYLCFLSKTYMHDTFKLRFEFIKLFFLTRSLQDPINLGGTDVHIRPGFGIKISQQLFGGEVGGGVHPGGKVGGRRDVNTTVEGHGHGVNINERIFRPSVRLNDTLSNFAKSKWIMHCFGRQLESD